MTPKEISETKELFPSLDHWLAFYELSGKRDSIADAWVATATEKVRDHFATNPSEGWACDSWGAVQRDTKWYLKEFGPDSISLVYGWWYELQLRPHNMEILTNIGPSQYNKVKSAFKRVDREMGGGSILMERGFFQFGFPNDRNLEWLEIAWAATNLQDEFVAQAVSKIECITTNEEVTNQLIEMNRLVASS